MNLNINPDEWTYYRNVWVRKSLIEELQHEVAGLLIRDGNPKDDATLMQLDHMCKIVWLSPQHGVYQHPPNKSYVTNAISGIEERFTWRPIPIEMGIGVTIQSTGEKKMWFRSRVLFTGERNVTHSFNQKAGRRD